MGVYVLGVNRWNHKKGKSSQKDFDAEWFPQMEYMQLSDVVVLLSDEKWRTQYNQTSLPNEYYSLWVEWLLNEFDNYSKAENVQKELR